MAEQKKSYSRTAANKVYAAETKKLQKQTKPTGLVEKISKAKSKQPAVNP